MVLCKFFQQGTCRYGNNCRFEHTLANDNRNQSNNRFGAFGGNTRNNGGNSNQNLLEKYNISTEIIRKDLVEERPSWILSAYGPGRNAPGQLFEGYPREQSFEELRLHYMAGKAAGNEQAALVQMQELYALAEGQIKNAVSDLQGAVNHILDKEDKHPNRFDICREGTQGAPFGRFNIGQGAGSRPTPNPFGTTSNSSTFGGGSGGSAFGQPSSLGQRPNPFGQPSQQSSTPSNPFGQPSQPAQATSNPFGAPGQSNPAPANPFGAPSQPASTFGGPAPTTSAFGQTASLGAKPNPFGTPAFGQPAQPSAPPPGGAFGQPSQLGARPNPFGSAAGSGPSPFASTANNTQGSAPANPFGSAANTNSNASPFAAAGNNAAPANNPFGSGSAQSNPNPFGSKSPNNQADTQRPSPFGQPSTTVNQPANNPFGSASQPAGNQSASNPFGSAPQSNGAFGQPSQLNNPFGQRNAPGFGQASAPAAPFGATAQPQGDTVKNPYPPGSNKQHPALSSYANRDGMGRLINFKGKSVTYEDSRPGVREFDGTWGRIWFPDGPPAYSRDTEPPIEELDNVAKAAWESFAQTGQFQGGIMPEVAPPREATRWDF